MKVEERSDIITATDQILSGSTCAATGEPSEKICTMILDFSV